MTVSGGESRSVVVRLSAEAAQYIATMQASGEIGENAMQRVSRSTDKASRSLDTIGRTSGRMALVTGGALLAVVATTGRFEKAMSAVDAATHETATNMDLLRGAALEAGADTVFSATESAGAIEELGKAGVATTDILSGGLRGALDLASAGNVSVQESAELAASAMNQFNLEGEDVAHVADLMAAAAGKAQGGVHELGAAFNQSALVASQMGLSIEETTASLAAFASQGLIGSDAGTSFKTMLLALNPQTVKARDLMAELGFSAYDASGQFVGMEELARRLQQSLAGMSEQQRNATLQTLFGRDAIRAANALYEEGATGIAEWTAAVDDQGYAAETAATRLDNLSGDIEKFTGSLETALINAGTSSQGSLRSIVRGATGVVDAFNEAPAPIQSTATALLAIGTATAGGVWLGSRVIRAVSDTRDALDNLNASGGKSKGILRGIALAGAGLAALTVGAAAIRSIQEATDETLPGVETLTARLIALKDAEISDLGAEFDSLGDSLDRIAASEDVFDGLGQINTTGLTDALQKPFEGLFGEAGSLRQARAELEDLDAALANLATTGGADVAQQAFTKLAEAQGLTVDQANQLRDALPAYTDALDGAANSAELAGDATDSYAKSTYKAANGTEITAAALKKIKDAYRDARKEAAETATSFLDIGKGADDAKVSLREWLAQMEDQAQALENFTANAKKAAKNGLDDGLIKSLEDLGPVGALRMKQLASATDAEIDRANRAWRRGQNAVEEYVDATVKVPRELGTHITVESAQAMQHVRDVSVALQGLNDKTIYITTVLRTVHQETRIERGHAGGGIIRGRGTATSDSILTPTSNGEYVVQESSVEKFGQSFFDSLNRGVLPASIAAGGGGGGGAVGGSGPSGSPFDAALQDLVDIVDGHSKKIDKALKDFEPKLADGVDGVQAEVQELRHAIREAGGHWTKAMAEQADALIEAARLHDVRKAFAAFDPKGADGVAGARSEIKEFRDSLREAGLEWTKQMTRQSHHLFRVAGAYELAASSLATAQANLDQVLSDQAAFSSQVGQSFNNSPFGNGLAGFDLQTAANANDSASFESVLSQLAAQGLDGPLFQQLAASGDLTTAMQLLATGPAGIALREQAFAAMLQAQQSLGTFAGNEVFGQAVTDATTAVNTNAAAVAKLETQMGKVEHALERSVRASDKLPEKIEAGSASGAFQGVKQGLQGKQQLTTARVQNGGR